MVTTTVFTEESGRAVFATAQPAGGDVANRLELLLRKAGRELADYQVARFYKIPEEMSQTPCDFIGFSSTGRALMIEAKFVNRTSLPIGSEPGLAIHQWNELHDCARAGGLALVCWARGGFCATIDIAMAAELSRDRRSIPWEKIEKRFLRSMTGTDCHLRLLDHWLPIITGTARRSAPTAQG